MPVLARGALLLAVAAWVGGCATGPITPRPDMPPSVQIKLISFNDLHGNLEPPRASVNAPGVGTATVAVPAGGIAYMASAVAQLRRQNPNHAVVSAGDMIGATPLVSALFLDEPTIEAVNLMQIDFNAVGNHEFDKGKDELLRMGRGGCQKFTVREPCRVNPAFPGANFGYLAANVLQDDGQTLFPATGIKEFSAGGTKVRVGFIGMTLKATPTVVTPSGIVGLRFMDEADTANALIPKLRAQGADAIVLVIHEGGASSGGYNDKSCPNLSGAILPILDRLDPAVDVVISGHTHRSYICDYGRTNPQRPFLLTSAGLYGTLLTDIDISIDTRTRKVTAKSANNVIVQGEAFVNSRGTTIPLTDLYPVFPKDPAVASLVARYAMEASGLARRPAGRVRSAISRDPSFQENAMANLIADSQLAATSAAQKGGAQIAFINTGAVRADLLPGPDGAVTYGQLFSVQPFANNLVVKTFTGAQIRALLEQQFNSGANTLARPLLLVPSAGFTFAYDLRQDAGLRISEMRLNGVLLADTDKYRVTMNSFLATGGDNFSVFNQGTEVLGGDQDLDALEDYIRAHEPVAPPAIGRITKLSP